MTGIGLGRRPALAALVGATAAVVTGPRPGGAAQVPPDLTFAIHRGGSEIGRQTFRFAAAEGGFRSDVLMELAVKVAFVTVYRYRQRGTEDWVDGSMRRAEIDTDDNGKRMQVRVAEAGGRLGVEGPAGGYAVDRGTMTDLGCWHPAIVRQSHVIDAENGRYVPVTARGPVDEAIVVEGEPVRARRYLMTGGSKKEGLLWFAPDGRLVQGRVKTRGEVLEFRLTR